MFQSLLTVGALSFVLFYWVMRREDIDETEDLKGLEKQLKKLSKEPTENGKKLNPIHSKWMSLGGGFYGVMGMLTYIRVEWLEIKDFIHRFDGFRGLIDNLSPALIIDFFMESLKNFITAISWPAYWLNRVNDPWVWVVAAYVGYLMGQYLAKLYVAHQSSLAD